MFYKMLLESSKIENRRKLSGLFSSNITSLLFAGHSFEDGNYKDEKL